LKEQLVNFIEKVKTNLNLKTLGETAAKSGIIEPILRMLGWDTSIVSDEVLLEYSVEGGRVDYCLKASKSTEVFLEAKKPAEDLDNHQDQLLQYSFRQGVNLAVLSNGITWSFYLPLNQGNWASRRFYTIDILEQESSEVALRFIDFLSRSSVSSGDAVRNANSLLLGIRKQQIIEETIPEAWNKITGETDPRLIELLTELTNKLCGFQPSVDDIGKFFRQYGNRFLLPPEDEISEEKPVASTLPPLKTTKAAPIQDFPKISQDELIPHIVKILKQHGGGASKETVETEIFQMFKSTFEHPWYQGLVSYGVPRWQHNVAWARERAKKNKGLIKPPGLRGRGFWELTDKGKNSDVDV
jgi:hypothetical protein